LWCRPKRVYESRCRVCSRMQDRLEDCIRRPSKLLSTATEFVPNRNLSRKGNQHVRCDGTPARDLGEISDLFKESGLLRGYLPRRGPGQPRPPPPPPPRLSYPYAMHSISDLTTFSRKTSGDVPPKLVVCLHILAEPSIRHSPDREHPPPWWDPKYTYSCVASARPL